MAATKLRPAGKKITVRVHRAPHIETPTTPNKIDVKALFDDTMRRYPDTMARLAE